MSRSASGADGIVKLEKIAEGPVVVERVHLLIDGGALRHEEEALIATASMENLNSLNGHVLEAGKVGSRVLTTKRVVLEFLEVIIVDISVEPDGEVALAKDTESLLVLVSSKERGLVGADGVALLLELSVVVLALERLLAGKELLSTTTKEDIRAAVVGPAVVLHAVEGLLNQGTVLASETGVSAEGDGGGIGKVGSRDGAPSTASNTLEDLDNCLDLGVVKGVLGRIGVDTAYVSQVYFNNLKVGSYPMALTVLLWPV